ncbi:MAG: TolB family protein [Lutibacter sp.]
MKKIFLFFILAILVTGLQAQQKEKTISNPLPKGTFLSGIYSAPSGTTIILQNNGKADLALMAKKETGNNFSTNTFNFPTPLLDSTKFKISIKKAPAGQTANIYAGAEGKMPQDKNNLKVGSDYTYDLLSRSSNDKSFSTFYDGSEAAVGGNNGEEGRYVTFVTTAVGLDGSAGKYRQIFWRDRNTGITKLISAASNGEEGNGESYYPSISGDGKSVAFESYSSNLVPDDKNGARDIFIWQSATNNIERVSVSENGKDADAESYDASVSDDGNFIAFTSAAENISKTKKGTSNNNVFLRDIKLGITIMISIDPIAKKGGGGSKPSISYDGTRIAFYSHTATLVTNDNNGFWDIFLWEKDAKKLKRISLTADDKERNQGTESANRIVAPAISGDGRYIAFSTTATNMIAENKNSFQQVYIYDINTNTTVLVSKDIEGVPGNEDSPIGQGEKIAISFDGLWVAFSTKASNLGAPSANIVMHNMSTGENRAVSNVTGSSVGRPTITATGGYVVFGIGAKLDNRFPSSGIFANYTGVGLCRSCPQ